MADPLNPTGTGGPPSPPFDPGTTAEVNRMADRLRDAQEMAGKHADEAERLTNELNKQFRATDKEIDAYKELVKLVKKKQDTLKQEWKDSKVARRDLERIVELHEEALKNAKAGSREFKQMTTNLAMVKKFMKELPTQGEVFVDQLKEADELMKKLALNTKEVAKAIANLGRMGATIRGVSGIFEAMGVGRMGTKIDRRMEQAENIRQAVADSREMRRIATKKHMTDRRERAIQEMKEGAWDPKTKKGGLAIDPETGKVQDFFDAKGELTKGGRHVLAQKMKFKPGTKQYTDFVTGEAGGAEAAEGTAGAGWQSAMSEGSGAISGMADKFEGGIESLVGEFAELIPAISILAGGIMLLVSIFDAYVKQNQEMEKNLGKGGMFTQPGVGAGTAFMEGRNALLPGGGKLGTGMMLGAGLGINWERNLAMAGALANSGMATFPSMTQGGNAANMRPGSMGEFMKGGVGEIQRIVMGAGRVGGLTDQEGVEQVIKLLGEYRETIASSEDFMARLNKDTAAAGISTTKYLKIIDEVSGAFDRMSKSLDQVTGVMRELSRYGSVSSETLKDMMEFLSAGQAKTDVGNMATAALTQNIMPKDILESQRAAQKQTLSNYVEEYNSEAALHGMKQMNVDDIQAKIKSGDFGGAQGLANAMGDSIDQISKSDPAVGQAMSDALTKVQDQINRVSGVMSPDFLKRASAQSLYGMTETDKIAALLTNIRGSAQFAGASVTDLLTGKGSAEQQIMLQQLTQQLGIQGTPAQINQTLRREGRNRINDFAKAKPEDRKKDAKILFNEIYKGAKTKDGIGVFLKKNGMGQYLKGTYDETIEGMAATDDGLAALKKLFSENLDLIAGSNETGDSLLRHTADGNKTDAAGIAAQLSQARGMAMRTQTVEDLLSNTFKPLLIKLAAGIEKIVTIVGKWFGASKVSGADPNVAADMDKHQLDEMQNVNDAIDTLNKSLDKGTKDQTDFELAHLKNGKFDTKANKEQAQEMAMQNSIGLDMLKKLETIQSNKTFASGAQEDVVNAAMKQIMAGGKLTGMTGAGWGKQDVTINNFYSSTSTMDVAQGDSPATATGEAAKDMKGKKQQ